MNRKEKLLKGRIYWKKYYLKNKKQILKKSIEYHKKTNYKYYKRPHQIKVNRVRALTRNHFPISNELCEVCNYRKADEHHHTTIPITKDCFLYVCHECHLNTGYLLMIREENK